MILCDTSALAKCYVPEKESLSVRSLLESDGEVCASELARVELCGVFHRRWREKKWSHGDFLAATRQFERDCIAGYWNWLPLDAALIEAAQKVFTTLPDTVFLRSSDCLHLTTAVRHRISDICTCDAHQTAAAAGFGLKVLAI